MLFRSRLRIALALGAFATVSLIATASLADLQKYVIKLDTVFEWQLKNKIDSEQPGDRIYDLQFVSQVWQRKNWQHQLQIYRPADAAPGSMMVLWVTGGSATPESVSFGIELVSKIKGPVAFVYHIPNQPLLGQTCGRRSDRRKTFVRYLKSEDESWPLLFPMVKSVVKAMDVLQEFGKKEWDRRRSISSSSPERRNAAGRPGSRPPSTERIGAIAPVVIDALNMREQMPRHFYAVGAYVLDSRLTAAAGCCRSPKHRPVGAS